VEDVQRERNIGVPVVHRLKRDDGEPPIDGQLSEFGVLDAVRPAPKHLARAQFNDVAGHRFGLQDHITLRDQLGVTA